MAGSNDDEAVREEETENERPGGDDMGELTTILAEMEGWWLARKAGAGSGFGFARPAAHGCSCRTTMTRIPFADDLLHTP